MKTDLELLELAAKAAGMIPRDEWAYDEEWGLKVSAGLPPYEWWNPLADDGDALRLAVKLGIYDLWGAHLKYVRPEEVINNPHLATRRAIVRAVAEVARKRATKETANGEG